MKKKWLYLVWRFFSFWSGKTFKIMKISVFLFLAGIISMYAGNSYSQTTRLSLDLRETTVGEVLTKIEDQSEFYFLYSNKLVDVNRKVSLRAKNKPVSNILDRLFADTDVRYLVYDRQIILSPEEMLKKTIEQQNAPPQEIVVTGKVTDEDGNSLLGVNIIVKGTITGTITNVDGEFSISLISPEATLVISFIGYITQEIIPGEQTHLSISLVEDLVNLEEVTVVGYGTQIRRDITGAVATLKGEQIKQRATTNVSTALQGTIAGLSATRSSSSPQATNNLIIRGTTTISADNNPLVLIDGVPGNIDGVNPEDIESLNVLKDASAAAIYGSRAAGGVILITTKRAKEGEMNLTYGLNYVFNTPTRTPESVDVIRYMEMINEEKYNDGAGEYSMFSQDHISNYLSNSASNIDQYPNTDWYGLMMNDNSYNLRHNLRLTAGTEKVKTSISFGYEDANALYDGYDFERYTARINNDIKLKDYFGVILDASFNFSNSDATWFNPTLWSYKMSEMYPAVWSNGQLASGKSPGNNPYGQWKYGGNNISKSLSLASKVGAYFIPLEGLKFSLNVSPKYNNYYGKNITNRVQWWYYDDPNHLLIATNLEGCAFNRLSENRNKSYSFLTNLLAEYKISTNYGDVATLIGYEEYFSSNESLGAGSNTMPTVKYPYLSQAITGQIWANAGTMEEAYRSYFGRLNYNYKKKYYANFSYRVDGSSKFAPDYRWGYFPSVSLGWIPTEETFMKSLDFPLSYFKLRASYGSLGNDRLGNYLYSSLLSFYNTLISVGNTSEEVRTASLVSLVMEDITWETTATFDIGLDATFFNHRLSVTADYFTKETVDMLMDLNVPDIIGFGDPRYNVGDMNTKGWELTLGWKARMADFTYGVTFNIFDHISTVGNINDKIIYSGNTRTMEGEEYREWYGYICEGIFQTQEEVDISAKPNKNIKPGDLKYKDISGPEGVPDGVISADYDRASLGSSALHYQYGSTIDLAYKGFDLSLVFQGIGKQQAHVNTDAWAPEQYMGMGPNKEYESSYWSSLYNTDEQNRNAKYPRLSSISSRHNFRTFSDYQLQSGAYFRFKNLTLGYTIPKNITQKAKLSNLRFYVSANDLFTIDSFPDNWDPEYGGSYFITKSYIVGLQVQF